jgi:hypothetical protein
MIMSIIPEPIKRIVRQQAGFGCCKCGFPIFEYHHIVRKSKNPADIMLLCPICHQEATVKAMTLEEQKLFKKNPLNLKEGFVEGKLKINQAEPIVILGSTTFVGNGKIICINEEALISLDINKQELLLSLRLYDRKDKLVVEIRENEWIVGDPLPWDFVSGFQTLTIRRKLGDISLDIDARKVPIKLCADIWRTGQNYRVSPSEISINGDILRADIQGGKMEGMCLNIDSKRKSLTIMSKN